MKIQRTVESYPVCPYFSCKNGNSKTDNEPYNYIKCTCLSSNTNSIIIGFKSGNHKRVHISEYCKNIDKFYLCPVFETIYCIENIGNSNFENFDKKSEIKNLYRKR